MPPGRQAKSCNGSQMFDFEITCCRWRQKMVTVENKKGDSARQELFEGQKRSES